jgi:hypothetical protein
VDPGRRAVETREAAYVRVGERLVDPHGVQHEVLEVVRHGSDGVTLLLGRLHGDEVREVVRRELSPDEQVRVRVEIGPTT